MTHCGSIYQHFNKIVLCLDWVLVKVVGINQSALLKERKNPTASGFMLYMALMSNPCP